MKNYYVYILSNELRNVFYIGFTNDIERRILEHKACFGKGFAAQYKCTTLLYQLEFSDVIDAIAFEKQLKNWKRSWKVDLIKKENPKMLDLAYDWFTPEEISGMWYELNPET